MALYQRGKGMSEFGSVTRCPWCESCFHVGLLQLEAAGGRVRCGGCLKVFDARDHFIVEQKSIFDLPEQPPTAGPEPGTAQARDEQLPEENALSQPDQDQPGTAGADDLDDELADLIVEGEAFFFPPDENVAAEDLAVTNQEPAPDLSAPPTIQPQSSEELEPLLRAAEDSKEQSASAEASEPDEPADDSPDQWEPIVIPEDDEDWLERDSELEEQDRDVVHLFLQSSGKRRLSATSAAWAGGCLAALLMLLLQAVWWQPNLLTGQAAFQRLSSNLCPIINCPVKPLRKLDQVSVNGLVLPSQEYRQALLVQAELRNRADQAQFFPAIQLDFLDLQGEVVASRRFQPPEYLRSEAVGRSRFEAGQRIQVQLEIYDPGDVAISYRFALAHAN